MAGWRGAAECKAPSAPASTWEVDAFFYLALAALVWQSDKAGVGVCLSGGGAARPGFVALGWQWSWLS